MDPDPPRCVRCKGQLLVGRDSATLTEEDCQGVGYGYVAGELLSFQLRASFT